MDWAQKVFPAAQQVTLYKARTKSKRFKIAAKRDKAGEAPLTQVWGGLFNCPALDTRDTNQI